MLRYQLFFWPVLFLILAACHHLPPETDNLFPVRKGNSFGFINDKGEMVISPQFAYAMPFAEGLAAVNVGGDAWRNNMPSNGKWGFINRSGKFVINPKYYPFPTSGKPFGPSGMANVLAEGYVFSEGLAAVRIEERWVYIDQRDSVVIDPKAFRIQAARRFSEGLAAVRVGENWGYINRAGKLVVPAEFQFPVNFSQGYAVVTDRNFKKLCINRDGNKVFGQRRLDGNFHEGFAVTKPGFLGEMRTYEQKLIYGLVNLEGDTLEAQFDRIRNCAQGLCPVLIGAEKARILSLSDELSAQKFQGGKWGYIDTTGTLAINPVFDEARPFQDDFAAVRRGTKWGYIDRTGSWLFPAQFVLAGDFHGPAAKVKLSTVHHPYTGKMAYINRDKEILWVED
jgi:hypothetical protein